MLLRVDLERPFLADVASAETAVHPIPLQRRGDLVADSGCRLRREEEQWVLEGT